jgi:hypothetical protein
MAAHYEELNFKENFKDVILGQQKHLTDFVNKSFWSNKVGILLCTSLFNSKIGTLPK